jgi:hypothetical protein
MGARKGHRFVLKGTNSSVRAASAACNSFPEAEKQQKEKRTAERAVRQSALTIGAPFRPHDLFDQVTLAPKALLACETLTAGQKLAWMALQSRLGKEGDCFPSTATLADDLGVNRTQVRRWLDGLIRKKFVQKTPRPPQHPSADWDTNLYELLWHEVFVHNDDMGGNKLYPGGNKSCQPPRNTVCQPGGYKSCQEKNHHHQKEPTEKIPSEKKPATRTNRNAARGSIADVPTAKTSDCLNSFSDDDERTPHIRPQLPDANEEFLLRLKERWKLEGKEAKDILDMVWKELKRGSDFPHFLGFDTQRTKSPQKIGNVGGYYRDLVRQFYKTQKTQFEREQHERERRIREAPKPQCPLGECDGGGITTNSPIQACKCELGQNLSVDKRQLIEKLNQLGGHHHAA